MRTMTDLASCQREVRVTSEILSRTQDELQDKTASLARTEAARDALQEKVDATVEVNFVLFVWFSRNAWSVTSRAIIGPTPNSVEYELLETQSNRARTQRQPESS